MSRYIKVDNLQKYCANQKDHSITPNDFQRMNQIEMGWHTGTPTEEVEYFVAFRWGLDNEIMHEMASHILYGATMYKRGAWLIDFPYVVEAWMPITPFEASKENT